ncbi:MAG: DUF433 domain-containing protein [Candidatus Nitricoxidivorans perseverans]|uniref:DUF433 domain-containing protein n=1 Tax=Candidatus Nitricoxidivorans perseverans TaxID=2975601 RepID=A0AA49FLR6_9PROT|nr:MAG: DUF433 domain-containing protein [Candidatus Nitricoxidivorans perseverans]
MDWKDRIVATPDTLVGKPRIKGTRMGVEFIMQLFASGWTEAQVLESYPHLSQEDLRAVFAFVHDCIKDEGFIMRSVIDEAAIH